MTMRLFILKTYLSCFSFSGIHDDYHTPDDTWKHINLQGTTDIVNLVYDVTYHLARAPIRPPFAEAGPKQSQQSMGRGFTITLGIMPSYTSTEEGLVIDSISKQDGPAAKAGIKKGDVIKSINDKPIKNIYDYMDRLGELEKRNVCPYCCRQRRRVAYIRSYLLTNYYFDILVENRLLFQIKTLFGPNSSLAFAKASSKVLISFE